MRRLASTLAALLAGCTGYGISDSPGDAQAPSDLARREVDTSVVTVDGGFPYRACEPPPNPAPPPPTVAVWEGYSNTPLPSGSDAVRIVLEAEPNGPLVGTVLYGTAAPPPSPPDSETCYPFDGADVMQWNRVNASYSVEGFPYPIVSAAMSDVRLQVSYSAWAPWSDWCACQVPVPASAQGGWGCLPNTAGLIQPNGECFVDDLDGMSVQVPCCKEYLCHLNMACLCTETACAIDPTVHTDLDLSINGTHADSKDLHLVRTQ
jgi:hypothetical protein